MEIYVFWEVAMWPLNEWFPIFRKKAVLLFSKFRRYTNDGIKFLRNAGALTKLSLCKSNGRLVPE
jgi:hypothetical protein